MNVDEMDENWWQWMKMEWYVFFIVIKLYHVIRICLVITFYFFVIRSYLVIKHYLVLKSYLVIKAKEVKLVKEVSHSLWHFACADVVWNNGITVWYCFLRRISFLVWALCQNRVVLFSARNLLFGLGLVSNPSKVGNSYKFCLSAPTTVNTSHAEAERPKTKTKTKTKTKAKAKCPFNCQHLTCRGGAAKDIKFWKHFSYPSRSFLLRIYCV